ncbi:MAG: 4'-phosphopantetheinyl transferase superfamily protein [Candidatus Thiodiazotropha sp.]
MLRHILSAYRRDVAPNTWRFEQNQCGKPFIAVDQCRRDLYFNLSHTNGLVALAVSRYPLTGVDIEMSSDRTRALSLTKYVLTTAEQRIYTNLDEEGKRKLFYTLWTLKEAYVKALGTGLSTPMTSFGFYLDIHGEPVIADSNGYLLDNNFWRFYQASLNCEYNMALAYWFPEKRADVIIGADLQNEENHIQKEIQILQLPESFLYDSKSIAMSKLPIC